MTKLDTDIDYELDEGSVWITVRNTSVRVSKNEYDVTVGIYALGREDERPFDSASVSFAMIDTDNQLRECEQEDGEVEETCPKCKSHHVINLEWNMRVCKDCDTQYVV